jgi:hypothetical protein
MCIIHKAVCLVLNHPVFICSSKILWKNEIRIYKTVQFSQFYVTGVKTCTVCRAAEEIVDAFERRF